MSKKKKLPSVTNIKQLPVTPALVRHGTIFLVEDSERYYMWNGDDSTWVEVFVDDTDNQINDLDMSTNLGVTYEP